MSRKNKRENLIIGSVAIGALGTAYLVGIFAQLFKNYAEWQSKGGMVGNSTMEKISFNPITCLQCLFTSYGLRAAGLVLLIVGGIYLYFKLHDKFSGGIKDDRGFKISKTGEYGTAKEMTEEEMKDIFEVTTPSLAKGTILGERDGKVVCMPKETHLNRNIFISGASGTMKSRAIVRNALLQIIKRGESAVITTPDGELYEDTAELFKKNDYEIRVLNLVDPEHSDSFNAMAGLNGDTLMAQVLTNVIIGNTSNGKTDHFWDNEETNLLKALILAVDCDSAGSESQKNLPEVYKLLTDEAETFYGCLTSIGRTHPARACVNLFAKAGAKINEGAISGLGTRLQLFQIEPIKNITRGNDIDLVLPAKKKCAYFLVTSDQDTTTSFISSLFFSLLFIKLTRYIDKHRKKEKLLPVNIILDEFNNIGRIGGAEDGSDFARTLSVCRKRKIRVMLAVQSVGQLQNRYPKNLWSEIVGNCDIQMLLGCTDDITAEYFSNRSGEITIDVMSHRTTHRTLAVAEVVPQYQLTDGKGKRTLYTPDELLRMKSEELLVCTRGQNSLKLKKFDYTKHPMSKQIEPVSVYDYVPIRLRSESTVPQTESMKKGLPKPSLRKKLKPVIQTPTGDNGDEKQNTKNTQKPVMIDGENTFVQTTGKF